MFLVTELQQFVDWTKLKIRLHQSTQTLDFKEREMWWASLGVNIGTEQNGKNANFERPVLILKKFDKDSLWIVPLSSKQKDGAFFHQYTFKDTYYSAILVQLRLISSRRLLRKIGYFSRREFRSISDKLKNFI